MDGRTTLVPAWMDSLWSWVSEHTGKKRQRPFVNFALQIVTSGVHFSLSASQHAPFFFTQATITLLYTPERLPTVNLQSANITPNPALQITVENTGGVSHADVSFNPDYQRQFAIVDEQGNWSIWDIEGGYKNNRSYAVECTNKGTVIAAQDDSYVVTPLGSRAVDDGWARILWVGDVNTIAVATRRHLDIVNLKRGLSPPACPPFVAERSADWILDMKRHPRDRTLLFVLTSARLYLAALRPPSGVATSDPEDSAVTVLMSWAHFRGTEDITLQLTLHMSTEEDAACLVLMHSRINALITVYSVDHFPHVTSSDPASLRLELGSKYDQSADGPRHILQLHIDSLKYKRHGLHKSDPAAVTWNDSNNFYQLTVVLSDLSVLEGIICAPTGREPGFGAAIAPLRSVRNLRSRACQDTLLGHDVSAEDDFIEADILAKRLGPQSKLRRQHSAIQERQRLDNSRHVFDYTSIYNALVEPIAPSGVNADTADVSFVLQESEKLLKSGNEALEPPLGTL